MKHQRMSNLMDVISDAVRNRMTNYNLDYRVPVRAGHSRLISSVFQQAHIDPP